MIFGGAIGYLYGPGIINLFNSNPINWFALPYVSLIIGAVIFFFISYLIADYIVGVFRWIEDGLIRVPVGDLFFGSLGLIIGLVMAYLVNLSIKEINLKLVSQIVPLFLTIILGYLGFQVGFRRRDEFTQFMLNFRKGKDKKKVAETEEDQSSTSKPKILDTSVIIDGRIADICETSF